MRETDTEREQAGQLSASRVPIIIWMSLVFVAAVLMQFLTAPLIIPSIGFAVLFTAHGLLHWNADRFGERYFWIYISLQEALIYLCAILMKDAYQPVLIGLLPILIAQSLGFSFRIKRAVLVTLINAVIFFDSALTIGERKELILFLPLFLLMLSIVLAYAVLFYRQVQERIRIQNFLRDLQEAHKKVEELTLANERQRMARDLHDTLAQGVAGLIMQLEATDAHLGQGNTERARSIVQQSMSQARRTLAEARRAIDNLRMKSSSDMDFREALEDEIRHFKDATGIQVTADLRLTKRLSRLVMEHSLHMIKECLTNVAKHAKAGHVSFALFNEERQLWIKIADNGVGFRTDSIGKDAGHYGLLGIQERVRLLGGELKVLSGPEGTAIAVKIPLIEAEGEAL
ncbi:sensor histidine kinase [Paenibacillus pinistramenti]|uniref:sensor histidine kinase n=1 Tax=Paenibacillus pinistramenti TaxID=1768003 RepID=UPI0011093B81|nr:sensor histidine kinase [Paenibacillus pinistramenti]